MRTEESYSSANQSIDAGAEEQTPEIFDEQSGAHTGGERLLKAIRMLFFVGIFLMPFFFIPISGFSIPFTQQTLIGIFLLSAFIVLLAYWLKRAEIFVVSPRTYAFILIFF